MTQLIRLLRAEKQSGEQAALRVSAASLYGMEWEAKVVKRLTELLEEHGGPEGVEGWLDAQQERRGPSRKGVGWDTLNAKLMTLSRLLWREMPKETPDAASK